MALLALINMVLILMSKIKVLAPDDQWISMALAQFRISRDDWGMFGCGEDREPDDWCFAAVPARGEVSKCGLRSGALGHKVLISKVKTLVLTFTSGCTLH
jgi:hypothetical protein